ncbi:MAG: EamA family transporter [Propionibacteriaceae bacterium]|nr:EamA family transporter [Propionibacteriaceae bacterium]
MSLSGASPAGASSRRVAIGLVLGGIATVQLGAVFAKSLFEAAGPLTMAWLRLTTAGLVLLLIARPRLRGHSRRDWLVLLGYSVSLAGMNVTFYQSMARIPVGMAVTIEFLGPLAVALATGRRFRELAWALVAALGVALLGWSPGSLTWAGVGFALLAGAGWACYILIGPATGRRWPGVDAVAWANLAGSAVLLTPVLISHGEVLSRPGIWLAGLGVGLLNSVIPYSLEIQALRSLEKHIFSILMSLEPAMAALAAWLVLQERLSGSDLAAMVCVVAASAGVTWSARRDRRRPPPDGPAAAPTDPAPVE